MRSAKVTKAFPHAFDGINVEHLAVGREITLPETTFDGLEAAGYVEASAAADLPATEKLNRQIIDALDAKLSAASDQDLKDIIARSGRPFSGNMVHANLVYAAKEQMLREFEGASPVRTVDPNSGVTEQPLAKPGEATPPSAAAAVGQQQQAAADAKRDDNEAANAGAGENKATNQFGDPLPNRQPKPSAVDLDGLKKDELEKLAADRGVDISAAKTKAEIIDALKSADKA